MRVEFNNPELPKGMEMDVGGLLVINGETVNVSDDELDLYERKHGISLADALSRNQFATVDGVSFVPVSEPAPVSFESETTGDDDSEEGEN
jgi:hypothetical protein